MSNRGQFGDESAEASAFDPDEQLGGGTRRFGRLGISPSARVDQSPKKPRHHQEELPLLRHPQITAIEVYSGRIML